MSAHTTHRFSLLQLRKAANLLFGVTSAFLFLVCVFVAWAGHQNVVLTAVLSGLSVAIGVIGVTIFGRELSGRLLLATSFAMQVMTLIFAASKLDAAYIEEAHMMFFVLNCYLLAYACWRSLLIYNILVILHHLVLTFSLPELVWTTDAAADGIYHLAIHASILTFLVGPLMFTAVQLKRTIQSNEKALEEASRATDAAKASATLAADAQAKAEHRSLSVQETAAIIDGRLQDLFKNMLASAVAVGESADAVTQISAACGDNTGHVDQSFMRTALNMDAVAGSVEELAQSVFDIARRADAAANEAQNAVVTSVKAAEVIGSLSLSGQQVGNVVRIIKKVAESINLLALNATIEAARAGEAGRGFAIVAQSVKQLAGQTSRATEDISVSIASIQHETAEAVAAINAIGAAISTARDHAAGIALSTAQQQTMTTSIAETAAMIARETTDVRGEVAATLRLLVEAKSMSQHLLGASGSLRETATVSAAECDDLLARLRRA